MFLGSRELGCEGMATYACQGGGSIKQTELTLACSGAYFVFFFFHQLDTVSFVIVLGKASSSGALAGLENEVAKGELDDQELGPDFVCEKQGFE